MSDSLWGNDVRVHGEAQIQAAEKANERQPCRGCGYMIRGGPYCGDCNEYGPPRDWRWLYDAETREHLRVEVTTCTLDAAEVCGDPSYCREHGCQL